jgi:hypothetical protein
LKVKIFYAALEETKEEFILSLICNRLYEIHRISIDILTLQSLGDRNLPEDVIQKIEDEVEYFKDFESYIEVIDSVSNPFGLYKVMKDYFIENGTEYYRPVKTTKPTREELLTRNELLKFIKNNPKKEKEYCFYEYVPNELNEITIGVIDHISLLSTENTVETNTLHGAMSKFVTDYLTMNLCKKYGLCAAVIHQQEVYGDKQQFDNSGMTVINKLLPSVNKLGDNKIIGREYKCVIGIFSPHSYKIREYQNYKIDILKNKYRSIIILKNRYGDVGVESPHLFLGASNKFIPLPPPNTMEGIYDKIKKGLI